MGAQRLDRRTLSKARPEALRRLARRLNLDVGGCGCNQCESRIQEIVVRELDRLEMEDMKSKGKIICVDFDGVLHSYDSGWKGHDVVADAPVPGAIDWLKRAVLFFDIQIYSSRSKEPGGVQAMQDWLRLVGLSEELLAEITFPTQKPPAFLTIDDRSFCFEGTFPTFEEINSFKPWNKR